MKTAIVVIPTTTNIIIRQTDLFGWLVVVVGVVVVIALRMTTVQINFKNLLAEISNLLVIEIIESRICFVFSDESRPRSATPLQIRYLSSPMTFVQMGIAVRCHRMIAGRTD